MVRWGGWAVAYAALACGCSVLTNLDGLSDGACAGAACADGAAGDAATSGGDAGELADGDAGASADAADAAFDGPWCKGLVPAPTFCDDFDELPITSVWTNVSADSPSLVALDGAFVRSAPNAAVLTTPANASKRTAISRAIPGSPTDVTFAYDVRLDQVASAPNGLIDFDAVIGASGRAAYLTWRPGVTALVEQIPRGGTIDYPSHPLSTAITPQTWTHVKIQLHLAAPATASVWVDDAPVLTDAPLDATWAPEPVMVLMGFTNVQPSTDAWALRFDDVVLDAR